jgi:hypothetical protein
MEGDDRMQTIRRTLDQLLEEHFFLEPKPFARIYEELVRPSLTSADVEYDRRLVSDELRRLVRESKLSMEGKVSDVVYYEGKRK